MTHTVYVLTDWRNHVVQARGVGVAHQDRLTFEGKLLGDGDERRLADLGVYTNSILHLTSRGFGGGRSAQIMSAEEEQQYW